MANKNPRSKQRYGNPAKEAEHRAMLEARAAGPGGDSSASEGAAALAEDALSLDSPLKAELWASGLLGAYWPPMPEEIFEGLEPEEERGMPLVEQLAELASPGALAALIAIGEVSGTELGIAAQRGADELSRKSIAEPEWAAALSGAEFTRAVVVTNEIFGDGTTICIEVGYGDGSASAVAVLINNNIGGAAVDVIVGESIDYFLAIVEDNDESGTKVDEIEPPEAFARLFEAFDRTDHTQDAPVAEDYAQLRALAMLRMSQLPRGETDYRPADVSPAERERIRNEFFASEQSDGIAGDDDEAFFVSLAINFACGYAGGDAYRWSPGVVGMFLEVWVPATVVAPREDFDYMPRALEAWLRHAAQKRAIPGWALEKNLAQLKASMPNLLKQLDDEERPRSAGAEMISAALAAGIDLNDEAQLGDFIKRWNQ